MVLGGIRVFLRTAITAIHNAESFSTRPISQDWGDSPLPGEEELGEALEKMGNVDIAAPPRPLHQTLNPADESSVLQVVKGDRHMSSLESWEKLGLKEVLMLLLSSRPLASFFEGV
jgi:hypothetical protein